MVTTPLRQLRRAPPSSRTAGRSAPLRRRVPRAGRAKRQQEVHRQRAAPPSRSPPFARSTGRRARHDIDIACAVADTIGNPAQRWKAHAVRADVLQAQGEVELAHHDRQTAMDIVDDTARGLDEDEVRTTFLASDQVTKLRTALGRMPTGLTAGRTSGSADQAGASIGRFPLTSGRACRPGWLLRAEGDRRGVAVAAQEVDLMGGVGELP